MTVSSSLQSKHQKLTNLASQSREPSLLRGHPHALSRPCNNIFSYERNEVIHGPLFIWYSGHYLTREACILKELVGAAGWNPSLFSSHSFRIGAATTAAATGLPDWLIQSLGRWESDCYLRYIRTPPAPLEDAAITMARAARISFPKGM